MAWDSRSVFVGCNALTPRLFLPAWPVAAAAGLTRRWALLAPTVPVLLAHVFMAPELPARSPLPAIPPEALRFRLFNVNVLAGNDRVGGIAEEIVEALNGPAA